VLAASQHELAQHFARSAPDEFAQSESEFEEGLGGCPRLRHSAATFECATYSRHTEGDHTIVLGRVDRHIRTTVPAIILHQEQMGSVWDLAQSATDLSHSVKWTPILLPSSVAIFLLDVGQFVRRTNSREE
jgi:flavin reductase (DIM6/NTAB) family NADH-FMN oxidoreductase RutF